MLNGRFVVNWITFRRVCGPLIAALSTSAVSILGTPKATLEDPSRFVKICEQCSKPLSADDEFGSCTTFILDYWGLSSMHAMNWEYLGIVLNWPYPVMTLPGVEDRNPTARCTSFSLQARSYGGATTAFVSLHRPEYFQGFSDHLRPHENLPEY